MYQTLLRNDYYGIMVIDVWSMDPSIFHNSTTSHEHYMARLPLGKKMITEKNRNELWSKTFFLTQSISAFNLFGPFLVWPLAIRIVNELNKSWENKKKKWFSERNVMRKKSQSKWNVQVNAACCPLHTEHCTKKNLKYNSTRAHSVDDINHS